MAKFTADQREVANRLVEKEPLTPDLAPAAAELIDAGHIWTDIFNGEWVLSAEAFATTEVARGEA